MTTGFRIADVAARMQKIETSMWKDYTALATLALVRGTKRTVLQTKVFGQDKPSATFKQAFGIAAKLFANGMSETHKTEVATLNLEEAVAYVTERLNCHMTALGVAGKNAYLEVADYASKEALDASRELAAADAKAEEEAKALTETPPVEDATENTAIDEKPIVEADTVAMLLETIRSQPLSAESLTFLSQQLAAMALAAMETEAAIANPPADTGHAPVLTPEVKASKAEWAEKLGTIGRIAA